MSFSSSFNLLDPYVRRARMTPALLVAIPLLLGTIVWIPEALDLMKLSVMTIVGFVTVILIGELGRDRGKRIEQGLFEQWGGMPTVQVMSHTKTTLSPDTISRRHSKLRPMLPSMSIPGSATEESREWSGAESAYRSLTEALRELTRDRTRFPLVFEENTSYGLRRNLLGLKPFGTFTASVGLVASSGHVALAIYQGLPPGTFPIVVIGICVMILGFWLFRVSASWVRVAAFAYAERLFGAVEIL